jgi:ABC-type transport system involved in multi-copper enzyme maturation permease subunit
VTIFDTGYSALDYRPVPPLARLWPLIRQEFQQLFKTRKGLLVFLVCIAFVVIKAFILWVRLAPDSEMMEQGMDMMARVSPGLSPFRREFYINHSTDWGWLPFLLLTGLVSVRSIAADKAANALEIYWTRGISPWGYFVAKWMGSCLLLAAAFLAGPLVLWIYGMLSAPNLRYLETTIQFMPQVLLALALTCVVLSFLAVGFSAMSNSPNVATFSWLLMIGVSYALGEVLYRLARSAMRNDPEQLAEVPWFKAICPYESMVRIQEDIAGLVPGPSDFEQVWIAWSILGLLVGLIILRLRSVLRTTEAVA